MDEYGTELETSKNIQQESEIPTKMQHNFCGILPPREFIYIQR